MGRKAIGMMCAAFAAGMCFGGTINVAAGETLELDLRESQVTNAADSVITLGAGATLKLVESTPSSTAGFAVYAMSGGGLATADWPKLSDPDPLAKFAWDCYLGVRTNLHWDVTYANVPPRYDELRSAKWYIPEAGTYSFFMRVDDFGYLSIDGVPVLSSTASCQTLSTSGVELAAGWHDVMIIFGNGINPGPMGPNGGSGNAPAIAYNASNVALTANNVATEGALFVDPGDGSVFQPVFLPGDFPTTPFFAKVVTEGAATLDASSLGAETLRWLNGGLRASAGTLTVEGVKNVVFGSSATNSYTINYPVFDVPEAVFTDPDATGFVFTNQVTACALPPAASCGFAVADGTDVAVHGTNTLARLFTNGALELSDWNVYILANTAVPAEVPIRVGAGRQLRYKPCYWDNIWTWYGEGNTFTNTVELLDASASLRFSSGQRAYFYGSISGVGDVIHDGGGVLQAFAAASQTGTVSVQASSKLVFYQDSFGTSSNTLLLAENVAVGTDPEGVGTQDTTVHVGTLVGSDKTTTVFNARSRQTVEIGTLKKFLVMNGAEDGTSAYVVEAADDAAIFLAPGVKCLLRDILDDNTAVRALSSAENGNFYSSSLELANPSRPMKWINLDAGREIVLSGTGTVNSVVGEGTLRLAEGADITIHAFDKTVRLDAGRGKLTILPPLTDWRDKVLLWLDPTESSTLTALTSNTGAEQSYTNGYKLIEAWYDKRPSQRNLFALNNRKWSLNKYDLQPQVYPYLVPSGGPNGLPYLSFGTYQQSLPGIGPNGSTQPEARRLQLWRGAIATNNSGSVHADWYASEKVAWAVMVFGSQRGGGGAILGTINGRFGRAGQTLANPISSKNFTLYADGEQASPTNSYFNGGWQILSFDVAGTNVNAIAWNTKFQEAGGQNYGEIILFSQKPTDDERLECEAYLSMKWGVATSAYPGEGARISFAGTGDVTLSSGVSVVADGVFSGTVTLSGGMLAVPGDPPIGEADVPSAGRVAWYDPNLPGALRMSTHAARPLGVRAVIERNNDGLAAGTSYLLGTYVSTHDRRPWLSVGARGGSATNWIDFSNIYSGDDKGNTLRRRTGSPSNAEDSSTANVSVNVRTAFVALDSSNGGGMPLLDAVGADNKIKARVPTRSRTTPIWTNTTASAVISGTTRLDGKVVNGTTTGYSGGPEVLSLETTENVALNYFGYYGGDQAATPNAEILGEILLYNTVLDDATRVDIEAYLMRKWTGRLPAGYADFRDATVTGSGTVRVLNTANLPSFANFDGTGVVAQAAYAFTLDASATPAVPDALTVPCALELPAACTATVTCATKPRAGTYTLISAPSFTKSTDWTLNAAGTTGNATLKLRTTANALLLDVITPGAAIIIR